MTGGLHQFMGSQANVANKIRLVQESVTLFSNDSYTMLYMTKDNIFMRAMLTCTAVLGMRYCRIIRIM